MPSYKVTKPRFFDGKLYEPNGRRSVITVEKKFDKVPAGLELIAGETATQARSRQAAAAASAKSAKASKAELQSESAGASFMSDDLDAAPASKVETL